jgi:hypothetical protein
MVHDRTQRSVRRALWWSAVCALLAGCGRANQETGHSADAGTGLAFGELDFAAFPCGYVARFQDPDGNALQVREGRESRPP